MQNVLGDFLACVGRIPYYIGRTKAKVFSKLFKRSALPGIDAVYGFSNIIVEVEKRSGKYIVGYIYKVNYSEVIELSNWSLGIYKPRYSEFDKLFVTEFKNIGWIFKKINDKFLKKKGKDVLKNEFKCWGRKNKICIVSTDERLIYRAGYLLLATKCKGKSFIINTLELAEEMLKSIYYPIIRMLDEIYSDVIYDDLIQMINEQIVNQYAELISNYYIVLPEQFDVSDLLRSYTQTKF